MGKPIDHLRKVILLVACLPTFFGKINVHPLEHLCVAIICCLKPADGVCVMKEWVEFWNVKVSSSAIINKVRPIFMPCIEASCLVGTGGDGRRRAWCTNTTITSYLWCSSFWQGHLFLESSLRDRTKAHSSYPPSLFNWKDRPKRYHSMPQPASLHKSCSVSIPWSRYSWLYARWTQYVA